MGKHERSKRRPDSPKSDPPELTAFHVGTPPDPEEEDFPSEPTTGDLWEDDPFYEPDHKGGRLRATVAVALCLVVVALVGSLGWMFGTGNAEERRPKIVKTVTETNGPTERITEYLAQQGDHITITKKGGKVTAVKTIKATVTPPARTVTAPVLVPTVRVTITEDAEIITKKISVPGPTKTITVTSIETVTNDLCFRVNRAGDKIEIGCP